MPSLIHLNGPPGVGKSTLSALYAERHPGTLDLDIDRLHPLVGGWRDPAQDTHALLRPVALAMAAAQLRGGRDVVLPQYLARVDELAIVEAVAREHGAEFREVVLMTDKAAAVARFTGRVDDSAWSRHNREIVEVQGGTDFLAGLHDQLTELLRTRPTAVVIPSDPGAVEDTYAALIEALAR